MPRFRPPILHRVSFGVFFGGDSPPTTPPTHPGAAPGVLGPASPHPGGCIFVLAEQGWILLCRCPPLSPRSALAARGCPPHPPSLAGQRGPRGCGRRDDDGGHVQVLLARGRRRGPAAAVPAAHAHLQACRNGGGGITKVGWGDEEDQAWGCNNPHLPALLQTSTSSSTPYEPPANPQPPPAAGYSLAPPPHPGFWGVP